MATGARSPLTVVVIYPDLLGTYGDGGNGLVLARRAKWRGLDVSLVQAPSDRPVPRGDIYCIGGGEDGPQVRAASTLITDGTLTRSVEDGAVILGVCAGFQLLGREFPDAADRPHDGLGLLDVTTRKGTDLRAVGELVATLEPDAPRSSDGSGLPPLTGFENHGGVTTIGPGALPLARVITGWATEAGMGPRGHGGGGSSAPTSTARYWPETWRWPTCCWVGPWGPAGSASHSSGSRMKKRMLCGPSVWPGREL